MQILKLFKFPCNNAIDFLNYVQVRDSFPYLLKNLETWQKLNFIAVKQVIFLQPAGKSEFKSSLAEASGSSLHCWCHPEEG
jgi:hypothetical protein